MIVILLFFLTKVQKIDCEHYVISNVKRSKVSCLPVKLVLLNKVSLYIEWHWTEIEIRSVICTGPTFKKRFFKVSFLHVDKKLVRLSHLLRNIRTCTQMSIISGFQVARVKHSGRCEEKHVKNILNQSYMYLHNSFSDSPELVS